MDLIDRQAAIDECNKRGAEHIGYAIAHLPSAQPDVPDTNVGDMISRQAAIDALGERPIVWTDDHYYALGQRNQYDSDKLAIETIPSVRPEQSGEEAFWKRGVWIPQDFNKSDGMKTTMVYYFPKCSVCGHTASPTNFCPNCGADMRGE